MDTEAAYLPLRASHGHHLYLRGLRYHIRLWGQPSMATTSTPPLVLLHGWMDVGASFQFLVDELIRLEGERRFVIAPDWRGFGGTSSGGADCFWFPDYLADLDTLLDTLVPEQRVDLLGHSMGGNVAMSYAGVRPQRLRTLVNLEGFGLPQTSPEQAPDRLAQWLDELKSTLPMRSYKSLDEVALRLRKNNPRLPADKARWLAPRWSEQRDDGHWHILGDPAHKQANPILYRREEALACWRRIVAPVLWVEGAETEVDKLWGERYPRSDFETRIAQVPKLQKTMLRDCGHMLHHDQPAALAAAILTFLHKK